MPTYGKNMRSCCDSNAQRGTPHINGCKHFCTKTCFVQMDDSTKIIRFDSESKFTGWMSIRRYERAFNDNTVHAFAEADTIIDSRGLRVGIVLLVESNEVVPA